MKKILVLASGGLDSSVVIALYKNLGYDVHVLYFKYGNVNSQAELNKLYNLCEKFNIPSSNRMIQSISLDWARGGALDGKDSDPYVEMRNLIFLSYAISIAEAKEMDEIAVGFINSPMDYKDSSVDFLSNINVVSMESIGVPVCSPLKGLDKVGVYKLGKKLGVNLKDTFSCNYSSTDDPCGMCGDCLDILKIIKEEGVPNEDNPFI